MWAVPGLCLDLFLFLLMLQLSENGYGSKDKGNHIGSQTMTLRKIGRQMITKIAKVLLVFKQNPI